MAEARALAARTAPPTARPAGAPARLAPAIDSEHSAIWQCLVGEEMTEVCGLVATASAAVLRHAGRGVSRITPRMACATRNGAWGRILIRDAATRPRGDRAQCSTTWTKRPSEVVVLSRGPLRGPLRGRLAQAQLGTPDMRLPSSLRITYPSRRPSLAGCARLVEPPAGTSVARSRAVPALRIAREPDGRVPRQRGADRRGRRCRGAMIPGRTLDFPGCARCSRPRGGFGRVPAGAGTMTSSRWTVMSGRLAGPGTSTKRPAVEIQPASRGRSRSSCSWSSCAGSSSSRAGHFVVARLFGMRVHEFGMRFPPRAEVLTTARDIHTLNWLPIRRVRAARGRGRRFRRPRAPSPCRSPKEAVVLLARLS